MKPASLRRKVIRTARREYRAGRMSDAEMKATMTVADSPDLLAKLNDRVEKEVNPWNRTDGLIGRDWKEVWDNIVDWVRANWVDILKIILSLLPLLILDPRDDSPLILTSADRYLEPNNEDR